ncbi:MAG: hypothetical protein AAFN09_01095 [Pseudomonadota bacterium]
MTDKTPPDLAVISNDSRPLRSDLTGRETSLRVTEGGKHMNDAINDLTEAPAEGDSVRLAFETIEATLRAENWFFETVRAKLAETAPLSDFPTVMGSNGHDYLLHFTQFLFFLKALDCTDADQISNYIEAHNARLQALIESPDFTKSPKEYRKAIFRPERKAKMLDTIRTFRVPLFAIYEYGHLLIDDMSPKTTEKLIEDLRYGGVLARRTDNRMSADQKRILICSTGFLEDTYRVSLLMQRRMIAMGISDAEYAKVKRSRA